MRFKTKTFYFSQKFPKFRSLFLDIFLFWHASFAQLIILQLWWVPTINYIAGRLAWENSRHLATLPLVFPPNDDVMIISRGNQWWHRDSRNVGCFLRLSATLHWALYNDVNATHAVIGRSLSLWSIRVEIHRWSYGKLVLFVFVQHGARFWKCFWDYFGLKQVKASKKV